MLYRGLNMRLAAAISMRKVESIRHLFDSPYQIKFSTPSRRKQLTDCSRVGVILREGEPKKCYRVCYSSITTY